MSKRRAELLPGSVALHSLKYLSLVVVAFMSLLPVATCLFAAFKDDNEYAISRCAHK